MADRVLDAAGASLWLLAELVALFLVVATAVAVAARRLGVHRLRRLLGGGRAAAAVKGIALGFVTPFCTYSAIPTLVAMLDAGVRTSAWVGFLLSAPVLDPLIFAAIAVVFGPPTAVVYTTVTFAGALTAAVVADAVAVRAGRPGVRHRADVPATRSRSDDPDAACGPDPFAAGPLWQGWAAKVLDDVRYAVGLVRGMAVPLGVAAVIAVAITGVVSRDLLVAVAGPNNPLAVPVAALVGTPLYVSGEAFVPIAAALRDHGMADGAVVALIVAGAGVNVPELAVLGSLLSRRVLAGVVAAIFLTAIVAGYAIPAAI